VLVRLLGTDSGESETIIHTHPVGLPVLPIWSWEVRTTRILGAMVKVGGVLKCLRREIVYEWDG
jgi:hypothetical protein